MIDPNTVSQIMNTARIEEVVSDYVTLRKRGVNLLGLCPFHDEKTGSFTVSPAKGIFKCFGCGKGGNAVHFLMEHEHISYVDALKMLAKKYNIEVQERELTDTERAAQNARESMFLLNEFAQKYFTDILHNDNQGRTVGLSYFRERGFRDDIIKKFQLGFALNQPSAFSETAFKAGYAQEYLEKTGLAFKSDKDGKFIDRFRGRVMFPVHTLSGKVIAFGGRVLGSADKVAKYVNSPESEIYHKSNELYGIYLAKQAIVKSDSCFLVEGYTDVISMHQAGIENVVASSGTSLTPGQIRMIHRFTNNVTVIYDGDAAGIKASLRGIDLLLEEGMNIKVLLLPDGEDPDSFARKQNASDFISYVEAHQVDFMRFKINLLLKDVGSDPIKRTTMIQDVVQSIAIIPDAMLRQVYVRDCSTLLDVDEKALLNAIANINKNKRVKLELKKQQDERRAAGQTDSSPSLDDSGKSAEEIADRIVPIGISSSQKFDAETRNLIQAIVRYGDKTLYTKEETDDSVSVGKYILEELQRDQIVFDNALYMKILGEYEQNCDTPNFIAETFFKFHIDSEISQLAVDLIADKYTISKVHFKADPSLQKKSSDTENLHRIVPQLIFELKNSLVRDMLKNVLTEIKQAYEQKDEEKLNAALDKKRQLDIVHKSLSETLRSNPVIKL